MSSITRFFSPAGFTAALMVALFCTFPLLKMHDPIPLLFERFLKGGGWIEIVILSLYAGWLTTALVRSKNTTLLRRNVWTLFSVLFFIQLLLGIAGFSRFLMSGTLHLPIPAMLIAAPVYRGTFSFFMPLLFVITTLFAGPVWCSWLCYFGSWDFNAARTHKRAHHRSRYHIITRVTVLVVLIAMAILFRRTHVPVGIAVAAGVLFGAAGVLIMITLSRKRGSMVHCTSYCPIGLIATTFGKINPFRIHLEAGCTSCGTCSTACRYGSLSPVDISKRKPGLTCTLCGDCIGTCPDKQIQYRIFGRSGPKVRTLFLTIVVIIHTIFIGFGRI